MSQPVSVCSNVDVAALCCPSFSAVVCLTEEMILRQPEERALMVQETVLYLRTRLIGEILHSWHSGCSNRRCQQILQKVRDVSDAEPSVYDPSAFPIQIQARLVAFAQTAELLRGMGEAQLGAVYWAVFGRWP